MPEEPSKPTSTPDGDNFVVNDEFQIISEDDFLSCDEEEEDDDNDHQDKDEELYDDDDNNNNNNTTAHDPDDEDPILTAGLFVPEDPANFREKKSFLDSITDAFQALSMGDKDKVTRRVYGIEHNEDDLEKQLRNSKDFQQDKLRAMEQELQQLQTNNAGKSMRLGAIQLATEQNYDYVHNEAFRLKFLRTENWDPALAAARYIRHFDYKLELFGEGCLGRDVLFSDLTKQDIKFLKKGYMQILPVRDRAGRLVHCGFYLGQKYHSLDTVCRVHFYMLVQNDIETEELGVVALAFQLQDISFKETPPPSYVEVCSKMWRIGSDMPYRYDAWHTQLEKGAHKQEEHDRVDRDLSLLDEKIMAASRAHYGNFSFWMNELMAYGMPHDQIPFTPSHKIKTRNHLEYLEMRKARREELLKSNKQKQAGEGDNNEKITCLAESKAILVPTRDDVLFGKGKPTQSAIGNQRLAALIMDEHLEKYHIQCNKTEKTALTVEIVQKIQSRGGRFLSKTSGVWREVGDSLARDKVSHMFRHLGTGILKQQQQQHPLQDPLSASSAIGSVMIDQQRQQTNAILQQTTDMINDAKMKRTKF